VSSERSRGVDFFGDHFYIRAFEILVTRHSNACSSRPNISPQSIRRKGTAGYGECELTLRAVPKSPQSI